MEDKRQNCLGYVTVTYGFDKLKEVVPATSYNPEFPVPTPPVPAPAVIAKLIELGFHCRQVEKEEQLAPTEQLIAFWGFFSKIDWFFGCGTCAFDFHFAKYENGVWLHKWGWGDLPTQITLEKLSKEYGQEPLFFAIRKKAP